MRGAPRREGGASGTVSLFYFLVLFLSRRLSIRLPRPSPCCCYCWCPLIGSEIRCCVPFMQPAPGRDGRAQGRHACPPPLFSTPYFSERSGLFSCSHRRLRCWVSLWSRSVTTSGPRWRSAHSTTCCITGSFPFDGEYFHEVFAFVRREFETFMTECYRRSRCRW